MVPNNRSLARSPRLTPKSIVAIYAAAGVLWVVLSYTLLATLDVSSTTLNRLEMLSGWFYVIVTAILLYGLIDRGMKAIRKSEQALRASEEQFRQLAEHIQEVFWMTETDQERLIYISPVFEQVWGRPCEALMEKSRCWLESVHPDDRERVEQAFRNRAKGNYDLEYRIVRPDGSVRWIHDRAFLIRNELGEIYRICGIAQDITPRIQARQTLEQYVEERTHEIEQRRLVAEGLRDILAVLNSNRSLNAVLNYIVTQAGRLLGADAVSIYRLQDGVLAIQVHQGLDPDYVAAARIPVGQSATGQAVLQQRPVTLPDVSTASGNDLPLDPDRQALLELLGTRYRALVTVPLGHEEPYGAITLYYHQPREFSDEEVGLVVAFSDQVALAVANAELRDHVERSAVAAERNRLARDLHDSVTQTLFSASLTAEVLPMVWERNQIEGRKALEDLRQLTRGALAEMRTLLLELRPRVLMKARLDDLLYQLAEATTGRARVPVHVKVTGQYELPPEVHVALYRIAQEALNNVAKHANATEAKLCLHCSPPDSQETMNGDRATSSIQQKDVMAVTMYIRDDGCGFNAEDLAPEHLGLDIMRERAQAIGATLTIESQPAGGTQVMVTWEDPQGTLQDDRHVTD